MDDEQLSLIAKALAHPARARIVRLLSVQSECPGAEIFAQLPYAQSTVSEHISVLKKAGVVRSHPVGVACVYCLDANVLRAFASELAAVVDSAPSCSSDCEECACPSPSPNV